MNVLAETVASRTVCFEIGVIIMMLKVMMESMVTASKIRGGEVVAIPKVTQRVL